GLDFLQHLDAAAESGVGLGPIAYSLVNLAENAMGRPFFEPEPILLRKLQRLVGRTESSADFPDGKVELSQGDPRKCDTMHGASHAGRADRAKQRNLLKHLIENPFGIIGFPEL